jgi:hypothetical protein
MTEARGPRADEQRIVGIEGGTSELLLQAKIK